MARRGGKAASRRSRQRRAQQRPTAAAQPSVRRTIEDEGLESTVETGSGDAFEKADAELRASTPPPGSRASAAGGASRSVRARTSDFFMASGPSRLTENAAAEYHYVVRDLRNIGTLVLVIAVLLAVAVVLVNVLGIGRA